MDYGIINRNAACVLELFHGEPLYFNQIHQLSGITSKNALLETLTRLVDLGILVKEIHANNTFYNLNHEHPLTSAALRLLDMTFASKLVRKKWYIQSCNSTPLYIISAAYSGYTIAQETGLSFSAFLFEFKNDFGNIMYSFEDLELINNKIIKNLYNNPNYFEEMKIRYYKAWQFFDKFYHEIAYLDYTTISEEALVKYMEKARDGLTASVGIGHIIEPFALMADIPLRAKLAKYIPNQKELNEFFILLTTPKQKSFSQEAEELLAQISNSRDKDVLAGDYIDRFYWIRTSYAGRKIITKKDVIEEAVSVEHRKPMHSSLDIKKRDAKEKLLALPQDIIKQLQYLEFVTYWQDERKKNILKSIYWFDTLIAEAARRLNIDIALMRYLSPRECTRGLDYIRKLRSVLEERRKGCLFFQLKDREGALIREDYLHLKQFLETSESPETKVLNGTAASVGAVIGEVKICTTIDSLSKVKNGDILVSSMTRPEYLPAMRKAAAFVTDEGGITCHAAIVAREMKKPCVIGTKNATRVLNDGDIVQVKGNHGIVVILKRAQELVNS